MFRNVPCSWFYRRPFSGARRPGVFHLQNISGISVWEERVAFVTSSFRGFRGRPGRLKDREKRGTGDKDEKSVNGTEISTGKFPPGKRDYLFRNSVYSGKFPFTSQPEF